MINSLLRQTKRYSRDTSGIERPSAKSIKQKLQADCYMPCCQGLTGEHSGRPILAKTSNRGMRTMTGNHDKHGVHGIHAERCRHGNPCMQGAVAMNCGISFHAVQSLPCRHRYDRLRRQAPPGTVIRPPPKPVKPIVLFPV